MYCLSCLPDSGLMIWSTLRHMGSLDCTVYSHGYTVCTSNILWSENVTRQKPKPILRPPLWLSYNSPPIDIIMFFFVSQLCFQTFVSVNQSEVTSSDAKNEAQKHIKINAYLVGINQKHISWEYL